MSSTALGEQVLAALQRSGQPVERIDSNAISVQSDLGGAYDGDDLAQDGGVVCWDRLVCRVMRHQPDVAVHPLQRLHRGFGRPAAVKLGSYDLAVFGCLLLSDDHQVAIGDRCLRHRVAINTQDEQGPVTDQPTRQQEGLLGHLHGVKGHAGRDLPDERHLDLIGLRPGCGVRDLRPPRSFAAAWPRGAGALPGSALRRDRTRVGSFGAQRTPNCAAGGS